MQPLRAHEPGPAPEGTPGGPAGAPGPRRIRGLLLASLPLVVHVFLGSDALPTWVRALGAVPGAIAAYAWWSYFAHRKYSRFPFLEYALLQVYLAWGFPTLAFDAPPWPLGEDAVAQACAGALGASVIMILAFPLGGRIGRALRPGVRRILPDAPIGNFKVVYAPLAIVGLMMAAGRSAVIPPEFRHAVEVAGGYYVLLSFTALRWEEERSASMRLVFLATVAGLSLAGLTTGMMEGAIRPLVCAFFLMLVLRRRPTKRLAFIAVALIVVLQPAKLLYRATAWKDPEAVSDLGSVADIWVRSVRSAWSDRSDVSKNLGAVSSRLSDLGAVATTIELVPRVIPFDNGAKWPLLLIAPLPRALMPGKPNLIAELNDRYNITFGFQTRQSVESATFNYPLLADGFWNFGWPGVVVVCFLIGLSVGLFAEAFPLDNWAGLALALGFLVELHVNGPMVFQLSGIFQQVFGVVVVCWGIWLMSLGFRVKSPPPAW